MSSEEHKREINRAKQARWRAKHPEISNERARISRSKGRPAREIKKAAAKEARRLRAIENEKVRILLNSAEDRAKKKGFEFELTLEWVRDGLKRGCAVTGREFESGRGTGKPNINSPSIDRIDSSKGYTLSNSRLVIWGWNAACNAWGEKEILSMVKDRERKIRRDFLSRKKSK